MSPEIQNLRDPGVSPDRDFREQFRKMARQRHRRMNLAGILALLMPLVWLPMLFGKVSPTYQVFVLLPCCVLGASGALYTQLAARFKPMTCPACRKRLETLVRFCPVCGTDGLFAPSHIPALDRTMRCGRCDKDYYPHTGVNRRYLIRYCTHCDAFLDNHGV